jgi:hypothetical protein
VENVSQWNKWNNDNENEKKIIIIIIRK